MDLRSIAFLMLFLLPSAAVLLSSQLGVVKGDTSIIKVPNDFPTIQEAINAAENGSTILVDSGVYNEHLTINKTLTLLGASKQDTIIGGSNDSITSAIVNITAENTLVDGFTLNGTITTSRVVTTGIRLDHSNGSTISGNIITHCLNSGIELDNSYNNTICQNTVSYVGVYQEIGTGIGLVSSSNNTIRSNLITGSQAWALAFDTNSDDNLVYGNTVEQNTYIILLIVSHNNAISHNTFIKNLSVLKEEGNLSSNDNVWSVGGKGNYWDDYIGLDDGSGGRVAGDGVGDTNLPWQGIDDYPLVDPVSPVPVFWDNMIFPTAFSSNSTVSTFGFDQVNKEIAFSVTGPSNTTGYFNISIPISLLGDPWTVRLDGSDVTQKAAITQNQTLTTIYLSYNHSSHTVQIIGTHVIPEYPTATLLSLLILPAILLTVFAAKKRRRNKQY